MQKQQIQKQQPEDQLDDTVAVESLMESTVQYEEGPQQRRQHQQRQPEALAGGSPRAPKQTPSALDAESSGLQAVWSEVLQLLAEADLNSAYEKLLEQGIFL